MATTNPYLKERWPEQAKKTQQNTTTQQNNTAAIFNMGPQSQRRNGSIKACKKAATRSKHKKKDLAQQNIDDGEKPFECKRCKWRKLVSQGHNIVEPHTGHHIRCPEKPINKKGGKNAASFQSEMEKNRHQNNLPPRLINASQAHLFGADLRQMFQTCPPRTNDAAAATTINTITTTRLD